jgi:aminoglycoside/choline kinase family phosphotransferase
MKSIHYTKRGDNRSALCVAESLSDGSSGPDATWLGIEEIETLELAEPEYADTLRRLVSASLDADTHPSRPAWDKKGWLQDVQLWLTEQLGHVEIEFHRTWSISSVARVRTEEELYYFKAVAPHFHAEPRLTAYLAQRFAEQVPNIVALDEKRGWLLLRDFGDQALSGGEMSLLSRAIQEFAAMQIQCLPHAREMMSFGFADRRLDSLARDLPRMLAGDEMRLELEDVEIEELRRLEPKLAAWCVELDELGPTPTLVHGDLHPNNINVRDGRFIYFDWTDAAIAHPFVDLVPFHLWDPDGSPDRVEALNAAYLEPWKDVIPADRLLRSLALAKPIGMLYHAQSYFLLILGLEEEVRWQMYGAFPSLLRRTIEEARRLQAQEENAS